MSKKKTSTKKCETSPMPELCAAIIEHVVPELDGGRYPVKKVIGDTVHVEADIFRDGHDKLYAVIKYRKKGNVDWKENTLNYDYNEDRWTGKFVVTEIGFYEYTFEAWTDRWNSWKNEFEKKHEAGEKEMESVVLEGKGLVEESAARAKGKDAKFLKDYAVKFDPEDVEKVFDIVESDKLNKLMAMYPDKEYLTTYKTLELWVDRKEAVYSAWYEMFHRSQGTEEGKSATWKDCINRLDEVKEMGFNVIYLPPIHPIGVKNRKGKNNSVTCKPGEPGSPWAIGNSHGGHKAVNPELGTLKEFQKFVKECHKRKMEIAIDFALNCSPDHPYVKEHPEWFYKRPDGTLKYAENPPKKYQDIYPMNLYCDSYESLWNELLDVFLFWVDHGVKIFRVDNPHTKPVAFWEWVIKEVQKKHPDVLFLAEAFTRPKMMKALAKVGYTQSYTYFTWRDFKEEIQEYLEELTQTEMKDYYRGNFFANTPDILPPILQKGGRPAFKMRFVLACTLSSVYGIYNGYELCENLAIPGREEYLNSEKYEYKVWDWNRPGNIKEYITKINKFREMNPALQEYGNLEFHHADNENILVYTKVSSDKANVVIGVVNLDPFNLHNSFVYIPPERLGIGSKSSYKVYDAISGETFDWVSEKNYVELNPQKEPAHLLKLIR